MSTSQAPSTTSSLERGLRVCLVPYYPENPYQRELVKELSKLGVEVEPRTQLKGLLSDIRRGRADPQVIHLHWLPALDRGSWIKGLRLVMFFLRIVMLRLSGRTLVWTVHNLYSHEGRLRWLQRWFTRGIIHCASSVIVHSPSAADLVAEEFDLRERAKLRVVPHGNYIGCYPNLVRRAEARQALGLPPDAPVLLFLGKIRPYKGVTELVEAFEQLAHPTARLVVAGEPLNEQVWNDIRAAARSAGVRLDRGFVADNRIQHYMNAADAVVFPYQDVLTSGAVVLAMSYGKACVAARLGCIRDMIDEDGGILYERDEPDSLKRALAAALAQPERLEAMGRHNLQRARDWSWARIARETAALYFPRHPFKPVE